MRTLILIGIASFVASANAQISVAYDCMEALRKNLGHSLPAEAKILIPGSPSYIVTRGTLYSMRDLPLSAIDTGGKYAISLSGGPASEMTITKGSGSVEFGSRSSDPTLNIIKLPAELQIEQRKSLAANLFAEMQRALAKADSKVVGAVVRNCSQLDYLGQMFPKSWIEASREHSAREAKGRVPPGGFFSDWNKSKPKSAGGEDAIDE